MVSKSVLNASFSMAVRLVVCWVRRCALVGELGPRFSRFLIYSNEFRISKDCISSDPGLIMTLVVGLFVSDIRCVTPQRCPVRLRDGFDSQVAHYGAYVIARSVCVMPAPTY